MGLYTVGVSAPGMGILQVAFRSDADRVFYVKALSASILMILIGFGVSGPGFCCCHPCPFRRGLL